MIIMMIKDINISINDDNNDDDNNKKKKQETQYRGFLYSVTRNLRICFAILDVYPVCERNIILTSLFSFMIFLPVGRKKICTYT